MAEIEVLFTHDQHYRWLQMAYKPWWTQEHAVDFVHEADPLAASKLARVVASGGDFALIISVNPM